MLAAFRLNHWLAEFLKLLSLAPVSGSRLAPVLSLLLDPVVQSSAFAKAASSHDGVSSGRSEGTSGQQRGPTASSTDTWASQCPAQTVPRPWPPPSNKTAREKTVGKTVLEVEHV